MKFTLANCLLLVVAAAALVAWQLESSKYKATLERYGERPPDHIWDVVDDTNVLEIHEVDSFSFIYFDSDFESDQEFRVSDLPHPSVVELNTRPDGNLRKLLSTSKDREIELEIDEVSLLDVSGYQFWKISWRMFYKGVFGSGIAPRYTTYAKADGTPIRPTIFLCDHFGSWHATPREKLLFSVLPLASTTTSQSENVSDEKVIELARAELKAELEMHQFDTLFKFKSIRKISIPTQLVSGSEEGLDNLTFWAVDFSDASIPKRPEISNPGTEITMWVSPDLRVSTLSVDSWHPGEILKKIDNDDQKR